MFSPASSSPRAELANFSVPRIRTGTTPMKSVTPGRRLSVISEQSKENASPGTPFKAPLNLSPTELKKVDIVLPSPNVTRTPTKWQVELRPAPLTFDEESDESSSPTQPAKRTVNSSGPSKRRSARLRNV